VSVQWTGLETFRNELRRLPEHLQDEAARIVVAAASEAQKDVQAAYPVGPTGNLKRGVRLNVESQSRLGARAVVRSTAQHAHIFEKGTKIRRTRTGANRGRMPEAPVNQQLSPIAIRARRRMVEALIKLVQSTGLTVSQS
jgi:hypothetical protein